MKEQSLVDVVSYNTLMKGGCEGWEGLLLKKHIWFMVSLGYPWRAVGIATTLLCSLVVYLLVVPWLGFRQQLLVEDSFIFWNLSVSFPKISRLHSTSLNFVHLTSLNCHSCWIFEDSTQCKATWPSATPPRHRMSSLRCTNQDWWQAAPGIKVKRTENDSRKKNNQTQQHKHKP